MKEFNALQKYCSEPVKWMGKSRFESGSSISSLIDSMTDGLDILVLPNNDLQENIRIQFNDMSQDSWLKTTGTLSLLTLNNNTLTLTLWWHYYTFMIHYNLSHDPKIYFDTITWLFSYYLFRTIHNSSSKLIWRGVVHINTAFILSKVCYLLWMKLNRVFSRFVQPTWWNECWYLEKGVDRLPATEVWYDAEPTEISSRKNLLPLKRTVAGSAWYRGTGVTSLLSSSNTCKQEKKSSLATNL